MMSSEESAFEETKKIVTFASTFSKNGRRNTNMVNKRGIKMEQRTKNQFEILILTVIYEFLCFKLLINREFDFLCI